jgi:hypothetical protein
MNTCGSIFTQSFYSGDDIPLTINFYQPDGVTPKPMTGYKVQLMVKAAPLQDQYGNLIPDSKALWQSSLNGDASGVFPFMIPGLLAGSLPAAPTLPPGNYFCEAKQYDPTGLRSTVFSTTLPINESIRVTIP